MSNPVVLITGALSGMGRAVAFAKKGAKVVVAGRRDEAGKALVKELRSFGSESGKEDDVRARGDKAVARFRRRDAERRRCWSAEGGPVETSCPHG